MSFSFDARVHYALVREGISVKSGICLLVVDDCVNSVKCLCVVENVARSPKSASFVGVDVHLLASECHMMKTQFHNI